MVIENKKNNSNSTLASNFLIFQTAVFDAIKNSREKGKQTGINPDRLISDLSQELAIAVQIFMESALVITRHQIEEGQSTSPAGTVSPGGEGSGIGSLNFTFSGILDDDVFQDKLRNNEQKNLIAQSKKFNSNVVLQKELESAFEIAREAGKITGANPDQIILTLANGIAKAIHKFSLSAKVVEQITIDQSAQVSYSGPPPSSGNTIVPFPGSSGVGRLK